MCLEPPPGRSIPSVDRSVRFDSGTPVSHHTKSQSPPRFCPETARHLAADAPSVVATVDLGQSPEPDLTRRRERLPSDRAVLVPGRAAMVHQSSASQKKFPLRSVSWRIAPLRRQWHHLSWRRVQRSPETAARGCSGWFFVEQEHPAESGIAAVCVRHEQSSASQKKFPLRSVSWRIAPLRLQWHHPDLRRVQRSPETAARGCSGWFFAEQEHPAESGSAAVRVRHAEKDPRKIRTESANPPRLEQPRRLPGVCWSPVGWTCLSLRICFDRICFDCACVAKSAVQSEMQAEPSERLRNCQEASARWQGRQFLVSGANMCRR